MNNENAFVITLQALQARYAVDNTVPHNTAIPNYTLDLSIYLQGISRSRHHNHTLKVPLVSSNAFRQMLSIDPSHSSSHHVRRYACGTPSYPYARQPARW